MKFIWKASQVSFRAVILELVSAKCFPVLLYGHECCRLNKADLQSLDFTSIRLFVKLFRTGSIDVVQECRSYFGTELPSCLFKKKTRRVFVTVSLCGRPGL